MSSRFLALACAFLFSTATVHAEPPFSGTIFLDPDIIRTTDPTAFTGLAYAGRGERVMFDRRVNGWVTLDAYLFDAGFTDGNDVEVQVNPEFGTEAAARAQAEFYARAAGQLPRALRTDLETMWIHQGDQPFGGGNRNLLVHTGSIGQGYIADGILEETLAHEAAHTSLDAYHANAPGWIAAQQDDGEFISTYARDNPTGEDVAESLVPWLAVRVARDRIDPVVADQIDTTIPNRLAYFDALRLDLRPLVDDQVVFGDGFE